MEKQPQRLFFMIKPDGIPKEAVIRKMIDPVVRFIACRYFDPVDIEKIKKLYQMHCEKSFYPYLLDYFTLKPVKVFLLGKREDKRYKNGFINDFIELVGDTDPAKAKPGTIRSLSNDALEKSLSEKRALRNLVHRSTTMDETLREAPIFFWDYILESSKIRGKQGELGRFFACEGEGIFYEERLEVSLRRYNLLADDEVLIWYQDIENRKEDYPQTERAIIKICKNGSTVKREITLPIQRDLSGKFLSV